MNARKQADLVEAFNTFDEDKSGLIDLQELIRCLRSLNVNHVTDAQIERRFKEADVDGSGAIDFEEFYGLWFSLTRPNEVTLQEVKAILQRRVVDRTGAQLQRLSKFLQTKQPFFQQLQPEVVGDVARFLLYDHISAGTILMKQGDKGDHMFIILSGQANVHIANSTSFKNVVHAIQHTRMLAKMASSSRARVEEADAVQPQASASAPSQTPSTAEPAVDAAPVKADVTRAGPAKRMSRFGQDLHAAAVSVNADVQTTPEQHSSDMPRDSSVTASAVSSQAALPTSLRLFKAKQGLGRLIATLGAGDALGEMALLKQGGLRTATVQATTDCEVIIMHRSIFESLMRTLKGHLLYQAEYLSRLLVKPPAGRAEADVLKLASYLTSLQRFQEVPQPQLVQLAKEVTYAELTAGTVVCKQGDDGDCMYIILRGSCNVHVDPDFDETAQAGALQKASLAPKVPKKKQPGSGSSVVKHLLRPSGGHLNPLDRLSSSVSVRSDVSATSRHSSDGHEAHPRHASGLLPGPLGRDGSLMGKGRAIAAAMAGAIEGESTKLTDDAVVLLEQQYGPLDRNLPTGGSFGELSLADAKLARRNATIIAAEPASLIRIDKQLYRKTLYEMQLKATAEKLAFLRQVAIFEGSNSRQHLTQLHFVLEKCTVQRGHIIIMEGQPCAGMFFIVTGQVAILARRPSPAPADAEDGDTELTVSASADLQASQWTAGPAASWWGQAGADQHSAAGRLPGLTGRFQEVALLGPTDFIGEVVASKHKYTATAECECNILWLKPQELHMLGPKSLGLAMQYNEMREKRWQQQLKGAAVLSGMQQVAEQSEAHLAKAASTTRRKASHKRPASAAVHSSVAASAKVGDIVGRPASLPVSHWARHQRHHHATAHPHLRQEIVSSRHFSRPRSAQPWVNSGLEKGSAAVCSASPRYENKQVKSDRPASFGATPVQLQACHVDGLASGLQHGAREYSTAASVSAHQAPKSAAPGAETVSKLSNQAAVCDHSIPQEVQLEYLYTSTSQPEASSHAMGPDTNCLYVSRQDAVGIEQSRQQPDSYRQLGTRTGSHSRVRMREQDWPPQGARWRSATLYKLQANSMHLPTAKEGVMGRMQCLQSAVSPPAHWSISSTCLHARPKADAVKLKGRVNIPYNVSQ